MRIDWIRHGQTPGNREHRYVGSTDESLTPEGRDAAMAMVMEQPQLVFVSPRIRCRETAGILYPGCPYVTVPELAECDFGAFEYKNYKELTGDPDYQAWIGSGGTISFPGGESQETFRKRCVRGFEKAEKLAEVMGLSHVAFVVHGGTIMAVLAEKCRPEQEYFQWQCKNLGGFVTYTKEKSLCLQTDTDEF